MWSGESSNLFDMSLKDLKSNNFKEPAVWINIFWSLCKSFGLEPDMSAFSTISHLS